MPSPAPVVTPAVNDWAMENVIRPTLEGMADEGNTYTGCLYAGLMVAPDGSAKVLEYNCRFGDPETQPIMMRMQSDLVDLCLAAVDGELAGKEAKFDPRPAVGVVLAAGGYPGSYHKGHIITGIPEATESSKTFHAGTKEWDGDLKTAGGRVLCATALGETVTQAQKLAYEAVHAIKWEGVQFRTDIAYRAIAREQ